MHLCYIDESGTSEIPGNTSHFVLAGLSIPIGKWKVCEAEITQIKSKYELGDAEIHTGWLLRGYAEQNKIADFENLTSAQRRYEVQKLRKTILFQLQKNPASKNLFKQTKKNFRQTEDYIHLSFQQRRDFVDEVAKTVAQWGYARLFAECIDKIHFDPVKTSQTIDEQPFEQVISRFEQYLKITEQPAGKNFGLLIHDNNETVAKKHTTLMKSFHLKGTFWTYINNIIETPLFVDSTLTSMIQLADVCAYAIRRYLENGEDKLFNEIFKRADRKNNIVVGVRHFTNRTCSCMICQGHKPTGTPTLFNA